MLKNAPSHDHKIHEVDHKFTLIETGKFTMHFNTITVAAKTDLFKVINSDCTYA
jgi:hypothetical protein